MNYRVLTVDQLTAHLRALRKARGLTQAHLGKLLGVTQSRVADIERDPGSISVAQMHRVLSALGAQMLLQDNGPGWTNPDDKADVTPALPAPRKPAPTQRPVIHAQRPTDKPRKRGSW